jgi:hypothetical protein
MTDLRKRVFESLDNAVENGYCFNSIDEAAQDLMDYDADLETYTLEELMPHVEAWFNDRRIRTS